MSVPLPKVYFIQAGDGGPIKIGTATDVAKRLSTLQTAHHEKLRVVATIDGGRERELAVHANFAEDRLHGEWFRPSERVLEFIDRSKDPGYVAMSLLSYINRLLDKYNAMVAPDRDHRIVIDSHHFLCQCALCWYENGGRERSKR